MKTVTADGRQKIVLSTPRGLIIAFHGTAIPSGWALCDGTLGTPDMRGAVTIGDTAVSAGTLGGTVRLDTPGLTHAGFAVGVHSNHVATQPAVHSAHVATQPATHTNHVVTQPAAHADHAAAGAHTHDAHTTVNTGALAVAGAQLTGPGTHASAGSHTHDAHSAHVNAAVGGHAAHAAFAVDAHSAHTGFAVDAHSAHAPTQADAHLFKCVTLAMIMKL